MFLTRIGFGSKAVVTGDVSQVDLPRTQLSGLVDAERVLKRVNGIAITRLTSSDVVRHPLVARIVDAYDKTAPAVDKAPHGAEKAPGDLGEVTDARNKVATRARKTNAKSNNGT
jgi:phosphate starvation-inducible PhoH-like protein